MNKYLLLVFCLALIVAGCPTKASKLDLKDEKYKEQLSVQLKQFLFEKEWYEYQCYNYGAVNTALNSNKNGFIVFGCGGLTEDKAKAKIKRDEVLDSSLALIDSAYSTYIRNFRKRRSVFEFMADLIQTGGTTALGIVNGERALQVLGVALTGYTSGRKSADLNFYDAQTTNLLIKQMDASRSRVLSEIKQLQQKPVSAYSFDAALGDIVRYFDAGTLNRAFVELDKQAGIDAEIARLGVLDAKDIKSFSKIPTPETVAVNVEISQKRVKLFNDLKDEGKKFAAADFLSKVYQKMRANPEFVKIFDLLENNDFLASDRWNESWTDDRKAKIQAANDKLGTPEELTGEDYYQLVFFAFAETEDNPDLSPVLQSYFNEVEKETNK